MNLPMTSPSVFDTPVKRVQQSAPGTFATGKGTTAKIVAFYVDMHRKAGYTAEEISRSLEVPSRQLSKRLNELVKKGVLIKEERRLGRVAAYQHVQNNLDAGFIPGIA